MKNDISMFPFETPMDSCFDSNNDGQLSGIETAVRDAALYDSFEQTSKAFEDSDIGFSPSLSSYGKYESKNKPPQKDNEPTVSNGMTTLVCFLVVAIVFGSIALCVAAENQIFLFLGTPLAIILLKVTGVMG